MRPTVEEDVCITTVVVKGRTDPSHAAWQHERVSQAVLGGRGIVMQGRRPLPGGPPKAQSRGIYLAISLLCLAGAVLFFYLAFK